MDISWQHRILNVERAWQYSQGYGVIIGLLDSEIESSLSAIIISNIAKGAKYILAEETDELSQTYIVDQIHRAVDKGSHIFCCTKAFKNLENEEAWEEVIAKAHNNNMVIVAPTGNSNKRRIYYPAGLEGVLSIGSCDEMGNRWIQGYWNGSNYGEKIDCVCPTYYHPTSWVWQRINGGMVSCANMCGILTLLKSVNKNLSYHEIQDLISWYSSHSVIGFSEKIGFGVPDVYRMLSSIYSSDVDTEELLKRLRLIGLEIQSIMEELGGLR